MIPPSAVLHIVATPIGNLDDITFRAVEVLRGADLIACEDTRKSGILLRHFNITTPTISLHKFSEIKRIDMVLERLSRGERIALITDAGTPCISDPGAKLAAAVHDAGYQVVPIPGPSSITAALSVAGMDADSFVYLGYAPRKDKDRRQFFRELLTERRTALFFDTPVRATATLEIAAEVLADRPLVMCRELTKLHEEILRGTAEEILRDLESRSAVKGEIVIVVRGAQSIAEEVDIDAAVRELMDEGLSGKRLADEAKKRFGIAKSTAYSRFLALQKAD